MFEKIITTTVKIFLYFSIYAFMINIIWYIFQIIMYHVLLSLYFILGSWCQDTTIILIATWLIVEIIYAFFQKVKQFI